ncbi:MAG TPA: arylesterase [Gammaproteobacteria bacterium]|nr:arylesterase [Gammaproteobacteria bacterium]
MGISKRFLLIGLLCCSATISAKPASPPVILVMGDSLSAAYGIETSQGWVALLTERLKAGGDGYRVVNASVSGDTSAQGLTRLPVELARHKPAIVILELGANDGLRGLSVIAMQANLAKMIRLSKHVGAQVLLLGILLPPNFGPEYTRSFAAVYPRLAKEYHVPLVPFLLEGVAQHREMLQADGMHPQAPAEHQVLDNVWVKLAPLLKPTS